MLYKDEYDQALEKIFAQCHRDAAYKERFLNDPKAVVQEEGVSVPDSIQLKVVEDTEPNTLTLHLPAAPSEELSDQDLETVSGGKTSSENSDFNRQAM
mgnify:CR=1 FL=1